VPVNHLAMIEIAGCPGHGNKDPSMVPAAPIHPQAPRDFTCIFIFNLSVDISDGMDNLCDSDRFYGDECGKTIKQVGG
jgi:hypothetical protein